MNTQIIQHPTDLEDQAISAVCFVQDYVELIFDGPIIRYLCNPRILIDGKSVRFPEEGSRDTLCRLIGDVVKRIYLVQGSYFSIEMISGAEISIRLDEDPQEFSEYFHFISNVGDAVQVW